MASGASCRGSVRVRRFRGHPAAWVGIVRLGRKDAPLCRAVRTFRGRTRWSFRRDAVELCRRCERPLWTISKADARHAVFDFVETFYNRRRRHSTLGYLASAEYDKSATRSYQRAAEAGELQWSGSRPQGQVPTGVVMSVWIWVCVS